MKMQLLSLPSERVAKSKYKRVRAEYQVLRRESESFNTWLKHQYAKQHARCYYCLTSLKDKTLHVDHIHPIAKGGTNKTSNLVLTCAPCNLRKSDNLLPKEKKRLLAKRLARQVKNDRKRYEHEMAYQAELALWLREFV